MTARFAAALAFACALGAMPAAAEEDAFCSTLKAAWTVAKTDPKALGGQQVAGATLCAPSESNLQCSWLVGTKENGRSTYEKFTTDAAACFASLGLKSSALTIAGSETTELAGTDDEPEIAIIYPGNATVSVTIIPPQ